MSRWRKGCLGTLAILTLLAAFPLVWRALVKRHYDRQIYDVATVPPDRIAIVFGAAVYRGGRLSSVLRDRMETAIRMYEQGVVQKIVVSGDGRFEGNDEPEAMRSYAIQRGVAESDIKTDSGGWRTYDTCYRARHIFQVDSAVLVTQRFHLPRALFTCGRLGIDAVGVQADVRAYRAARWYEFRETVASVVALWDVIRQQQPAVLGAPIALD